MHMIASHESHVGVKLPPNVNTLQAMVTKAHPKCHHGASGSDANVNVRERSVATPHTVGVNALMCTHPVSFRRVSESISQATIARDDRVSNGRELLTTKRGGVHRRDQTLPSSASLRYNVPRVEYHT